MDVQALRQLKPELDLFLDATPLGSVGMRPRTMPTALSRTPRWLLPERGKHRRSHRRLRVARPREKIHRPVALVR